MRNTLGRARGTSLIRRLSILVAVVMMSSFIVACTNGRNPSVRLSGTPLVSLDEGAGEVLLLQPGSFRGVPLDTLTRISIGPDTLIALDDGRSTKAANIDGAHLPEYLIGLGAPLGTPVDIEAQGRRGDLVAVAIRPREDSVAPASHETWPSLCGPEPGVFVGVLGASSGQVLNGQFTPSFEFTTPESDDPGAESWYMITAWSAPGATVPIDGKLLDISAHDDEFIELVDKKLVRIELESEVDRWYLRSVEVLRDADTAWPPRL